MRNTLAFQNWLGQLTFPRSTSLVDYQRRVLLSCRRSITISLHPFTYIFITWFILKRELLKNTKIAQEGGKEFSRGY